MNWTILLLGPTGSGKGTQAQLLADQGHFVHLSTGDLIRAEIGAGTELGRSIEAGYAAGVMVPDELIQPLFMRTFRHLPEGSDVLLDGFPRNLVQAKWLEGFLSGMGRKVDRVVLIEVSAEDVQRRLGTRRICPSCRRIFAGGETECPRDGAKLVVRSDDAPEAIQEKLRLFEREIRPVIDYYEARGLLRRVDGEQPPEEVVAEIGEVLGDL